MKLPIKTKECLLDVQQKEKKESFKAVPEKKIVQSYQHIIYNPQFSNPIQSIKFCLYFLCFSWINLDYSLIKIPPKASSTSGNAKVTRMRSLNEKMSQISFPTATNVSF